MGTKRERILQKLNPMLLKITPKLSGDEGSFIDLDFQDSLEDGAKKLMMRFIKNQDLCEKNKRKSVQNDSEVMISSAKYNENEEICGLITEKLSMSFARNEESEVCERPGHRLQKLKVELQEKMTAKWEEEYKKRINESKSFDMKYKNREKCGYFSDAENEDKDGNDDDTAENYSDDDDDDGEEADDECEEGDNDSDATCSSSKGQSIEDNHCKNKREKTPEKKDGYDDDEMCSLVPAYQPGGGLLYGGSELTQNEEELPQNLMSPSLKFSMNESPGCKIQSQSFSDTTPKKDLTLNEDGNNSFSQKNKLFSQNQNNSFDLNDAFEFCSGKFPDNPEAQNLLEEQMEANDFHSNVDDEENDDFDECEDGNSSKREPEKNSAKTRKNILAFEESEEEKEEKEEKGTENEVEMKEAEEGNSSVLKLLSDDESEMENKNVKMRKRKNRKSLHFSDEEEEEEGGGGEEEEEETEEKEEEDVRSIHYDSEENEIINPKEFFEKEAELSGSEWSGDEDERGLDELDAEEGDADHLDSSQVRSQLEKIHIRRVLDDDAREVRLIQEILFEDGDLHSDGKRRDRKFKWKNLGAFEENAENGNEGKEEGGNESEDEGGEEEQQRKLRLEKELFLMTKKKNGDESSEDEITSDIQMIKVTRVKTTGNSDHRTNKITTLMDHSETVKNSHLSNCRGSFLRRNEEFLSRLAKATAAVSDSILGARNCGNFVFARKSPEKSDSERAVASEGKRRMKDAGSCGREEKRAKVLPAEGGTGPSILDLLV